MTICNLLARWWQGAFFRRGRGSVKMCQAGMATDKEAKCYFALMTKILGATLQQLLHSCKFAKSLATSRLVYNLFFVLGGNSSGSSGWIVPKAVVVYLMRQSRQTVFIG